MLVSSISFADQNIAGGGEALISLLLTRRSRCCCFLRQEAKRRPITAHGQLDDGKRNVGNCQHPIGITVPPHWTPITPPSSLSLLLALRVGSGGEVGSPTVTDDANANTVAPQRERV